MGGEPVTYRRLLRRPLMVLTIVVVAVVVRAQVLASTAPTPSVSASSASPSAPASAAARSGPKQPAELRAEDLAGVEDPDALLAAGRHWLASDEKLARQCFEAAIAKNEINLYRKLEGTPFAEALVLELMGQMDQAAEAWTTAFDSDLLAAYYFLSHLSQHPQRAQLRKTARELVSAAVDTVKRGGKVSIYTTKKGEKRYLQLVSDEDVEAALSEGKKIRYAYIDKLDLRGRTLDKRVSCQNCIVGGIEAWEADIKEQFDFRGFVLGDAHFGKKWKGERNNSAVLPAATFNRLYLEYSVFLGNVDFDSVRISGRVANFPLAVFDGEANLRNMQFDGTAEFRFAHFGGPASLKGSRFGGSAYFSYSHWTDLDMSRVAVDAKTAHFASTTFNGDLLVEDATFQQGFTLEHATFHGDAFFRRSKVEGVLNFSRTVAHKNLTLSRMEVKDLLFYGGEVFGVARFDDGVFSGRARFSLDELTRRQHLSDVTPLHKLYKLYQGDDDAEEDLTSQSQYGVRSVDDLVSRFHSDVSFANTYFEQFVGFERVAFGTKDKGHIANFYNTQFQGEAHFERARFNGVADFRTIAGEELSFNRAKFHKAWMLDDANVPGRLTTTEVDLLGDATISVAGADIASFGLSYRQLLLDGSNPWSVDGQRLFYVQCLAKGRDNKALFDDLRLADARWDSTKEQPIEDATLISKRIEELCVDRSIDEFTRLRDSFEARSKSAEADWAYWHLKHYQNHQAWVTGTGAKKVGAVAEKLMFEKAFGWGVLLTNLIFTSFCVICFFAVLQRYVCGEMVVEWDHEKMKYSELPWAAVFIVSIHGFLGGLGDAENLIPSSNKTWKYLYTAEIIIGIVVITFFIGAYTRMVVSGGA